MKPIISGLTILMILCTLDSQANPGFGIRSISTDSTARSVKKDSTRGQNEDCIYALRRMQESMSGVTENGNKYSLYAFKRGKQWTYLVLDSTGYFSVKQSKDEELKENSVTYTDMLCLMTRANMIKKKDRPKLVSGLTLSCYYKFRPQGKKMYRSVNRMINQADRISKAVKEGPKGLKKLFL